MLMIRTLRHNVVLSPVPVRESGRLRPSVTGHTAAECAAQAGNAFRRRVPGRRIDNICLEDISLRQEETLNVAICAVTRCLARHMRCISYRAHEPEKCFRSKLRHFPVSCTRLLIVEVFSDLRTGRVLNRYFSDIKLKHFLT